MAPSAESQSFKVILTAASDEAHLLGMTASMRPLLLIGVPLNATSLRGMDSLLNIAQMPTVSSFYWLNSPVLPLILHSQNAGGDGEDQ